MGKCSEMANRNDYKKTRLLVVEPYYDGSHRIFLEGLTRHCPVRIDLHTLPAHSWKWRMRFAAPYFANKLENATGYEAIFCSSMLDVAAFRGLGPPWLRTLRLVTYFHENQFAYPTRKEDKRDLHFAVTNLTTALASDRVVFNSRFNRDTFFAGAEELTGRMPDMKNGVDLEKLRRKVVVLHPPVDFLDIDRNREAYHDMSGQEAPLIVWNHRWEHDKNPSRFFGVLKSLAKRNIPFRLALLGQSYRDTPSEFTEAEKFFKRQLVHFGFAPRELYCQLLRQGTVVVSTAMHEFYGMAVLEAVRAGCRPLLPDRLSYRELYPKQFLYREGELEDKLICFLQRGRLTRDEALALTEEKSWCHLAPAFIDLLLEGKGL